MPSEFAEALLANCHWRQAEPGTGLQLAGEASGGLLGLAAGTASITTALTTPDAPMVFVAHPGFWFGFVPLFLPVGLSNSVVARSDVTFAYMSQPEVEAFLARRPEWWRHVGALGVLNANLALSVCGDLMIRDSRRRCAAVLLQLTDCRFVDAHGAQSIDAPLSQDELAAIANLSRTSVSTILHDLELAGMISLGYRTVRLLDLGRLRALVDG